MRRAVRDMMKGTLCVICRRRIFAPATVRTPVCGACILKGKG